MVTFDDFRHAFVQAEEDIKYAELAIDSLSSEENENCVADVAPRGVIVPSINELRYAALPPEASMFRFFTKCLWFAVDEVSSIFLEIGKTMFFVTDIALFGTRKQRSGPQIKQSILIDDNFMTEADWQAIASDVAIVGSDMRKGMDLYVKRTRTESH